MTLASDIDAVLADTGLTRQEKRREIGRIALQATALAVGTWTVGTRSITVKSVEKVQARNGDWFWKLDYTATVDGQIVPVPMPHFVRVDVLVPDPAGGVVRTISDPITGAQDTVRYRLDPVAALKSHVFDMVRMVARS